MRLIGLAATKGDAAVDAFVKAAIDMGATFFEHADIYGGGLCEAAFAKVLAGSPSLRAKLQIQSKCGIVPGKCYDLSKEHILEAVDGSLKRLGTEYLDFLLLHRPDILCEPEEVAEAFDALEEAGKVRYFGVSNMKPMQIKLLRKAVKQPLVVNQLQLSIMHAGMMSQGIHVNMTDPAAADTDGSVLDWCRLHDISIQCWSPFQFGMFEGSFLGNPRFPELNKALEEVAAAHSVSPSTIAAAWLLRHPARMQVVAGTMNTEHLAEVVAACDVELSRAEWYRIYLAAGNTLP
jgi:predicted oxidoreductase